jgi:putative membrane protein
VEESNTEVAVTTETVRARMVITALTGVVFLGVLVVIYLLPHQAHQGGPSALASLNAALNAGATCFLVAGYVFIRKRNIVWHRRSMLAAFGLSCMFLLTYLLHHARVGSVPYAGQGVLRVVYFALLIPHILLAALVVPMALSTIYRAWTGKVESHRRMARLTWPIWLYVSASGVLLYFMLYGR